jgi:uncharacterized protein VirK/YbjX
VNDKNDGPLELMNLPSRDLSAGQQEQSALETAEALPAAPMTNVSLAPILMLARAGRSWSPRRLFPMLSRIVFGFPRQLEIFHILKRPAYADLVRIDPRLPYKCLTSDYLARGLTIVERQACFAYHYRRMAALLPDHLLRQALFSWITLEEIHEDGHTFVLKMGRSRPKNREGEMSLLLDVDGELVSILSFTLVPGWVVKSEAEEVLLITCLQGKPQKFSQVHLAMKSLQGVAPAAFLIAALSGVALAFGIQEMAGICAESQTCYGRDDNAAFKASYDDFWIALGATQRSGNFFLGPLPPREKPLELVKPGNRPKRKAQRAFKRQIIEKVSNLLRDSRHGDIHDSLVAFVAHPIRPAAPEFECQPPTPFSTSQEESPKKENQGPTEQFLSRL